jgi:hypothetical protein
MGKEVSGRRGRRPLQFDDLCFVKWSGLAYDRSFFMPFYLLPIAQKKAYMTVWFCA